MADVLCKTCNTTGDDSLGVCRFCGVEIKAAQAPTAAKTAPATDKKSTTSGQ